MYTVEQNQGLMAVQLTHLIVSAQKLPLPSLLWQVQRYIKAYKKDSSACYSICEKKS